MKTTLPLLTEEIEQRIFVQWLELQGLKFTAIPNSTYTKSWSQKAKNTATGLRPGLPDLLIIVNGSLVFVEMKRTKQGVVSAAQQSWIEELNKVANVQAFVCLGAEAAIKIVQSYLPKQATHASTEIF